MQLLFLSLLSAAPPLAALVLARRGAAGVVADAAAAVAAFAVNKNNKHFLNQAWVQNNVSGGNRATEFCDGLALTPITQAGIRRTNEPRRTAGRSSGFHSVVAVGTRKRVTRQLYRYNLSVYRSALVELTTAVAVAAAIMIVMV